MIQNTNPETGIAYGVIALNDLNQDYIDPWSDGIDVSSRTAYRDAVGEETMWRRNTKYGRLRWELLDYLIEKLSQETGNLKETTWR